jgi:hypothetical protein
MSKNIKQVFDTNPITSNAATDLMYFGQSPYGIGDDAAMEFSDFAAQFSTSILPNNQIFVGNISNVATAVTMSGDASIINTGALTITNNAVTYAKFQQVAALSVVGRSANSLGNAAAISATVDGQLLRTAGSVLGFGSIDLSLSATVGSSILNISNGGTSSSSQTIGGICYVDAAPAILSNSNFTYNGSNAVVLTSGSSAGQISIINTLTGSTNNANLILQRGDQANGVAQIRLSTGATQQWRVGLKTGDSSFYFNDNVSGLDRLILDQSGNVNIPILSVSLPVFTDASKNLTTTGVVPAASGGTGQSSYAVGDMLYASGNTALSKITGNITTGKQYLSQTGNGAVAGTPVWATVSGSDITGAALTKTDDTNVTLTLGGTPTTALLRATSLTLGWTGTLALSRGGSANSSFSTNGVLYVNSGGTAFVNSNGFTFNGSSITLNGSSTRSISITTTTGGAEANIDLERNNTSGYGQIHFKTNGTEDWAIGTRAGGSGFNFFYNNATLLMTLSTAGVLNLSALTANTFLFSDSSKNVSSTGTAVLGIANGGTNATSANYASNGMLTYDGTRFVCPTGITATGNQINVTNSTAGFGATLIVDQTDNTTGNSNALLRARTGGALGGDPFTRYTINGVTDWCSGIDNSDSDAYIICNGTSLGSGNKLRILSDFEVVSGNLNTVAGDILISTVNKGLSIKGAAVSAGTANASFVTSVVLVGGTVTVNNSFVTTACSGTVAVVTAGGTPGTGYRLNIGSGSFTVTSSSALDTSTLTVAFFKGI